MVSVHHRADKVHTATTGDFPRGLTLQGMRGQHSAIGVNTEVNFKRVTLLGLPVRVENEMKYVFEVPSST